MCLCFACSVHTTSLISIHCMNCAKKWLCRPQRQFETIRWTKPCHCNAKLKLLQTTLYAEKNIASNQDDQNNYSLS